MLYGSLKRGFYNHQVLPKNSRFICDVLSEPNYTMIDLGHYPGVIEDGTEVIKGELWSISDIEPLDELEENGRYYTRYQKTFFDKTEQKYNAWIYLLPSDFSYDKKAIISSGFWKQNEAPLNHSLFATLPDWVNWLAQDADGAWWGYEVEPLQFHRGWYENEVGRYIKVMQSDLNNNWKNTLIKR